MDDGHRYDNTLSDDHGRRGGNKWRSPIIAVAFMFISKFGAHFVKASTPKTTTDSLQENNYVV